MQDCLQCMVLQNQLDTTLSELEVMRIRYGDLEAERNMLKAQTEAQIKKIDDIHSKVSNIPGTYLFHLIHFLFWIGLFILSAL